MRGDSEWEQLGLSPIFHFLDSPPAPWPGLSLVLPECFVFLQETKDPAMGRVALWGRPFKINTNTKTETKTEKENEIQNGKRKRNPKRKRKRKKMGRTIFRPYENRKKKKGK